MFLFILFFSFSITLYIVVFLFQKHYIYNITNFFKIFKLGCNFTPSFFDIYIEGYIFLAGLKFALLRQAAPFALFIDPLRLDPRPAAGSAVPRAGCMFLQPSLVDPVSVPPPIGTPSPAHLYRPLSNLALQRLLFLIECIMIRSILQ